MHTTHLLPGRIGLLTLEFLVGKPATTREPTGSAHPHDRLDLFSCSPCDAPPAPDADVLMCKLSLTRDDARSPRPRKGAFGYDFDPFM